MNLYVLLVIVLFFFSFDIFVFAIAHEMCTVPLRGCVNHERELIVSGLVLRSG